MISWAMGLAEWPSWSCHSCNLVPGLTCLHQSDSVPRAIQRREIRLQRRSAESHSESLIETSIVWSSTATRDQINRNPVSLALLRPVKDWDQPNFTVLIMILYLIFSKVKDGTVLCKVSSDSASFVVADR